MDQVPLAAVLGCPRQILSPTHYDASLEFACLCQQRRMREVAYDEALAEYEMATRRLRSTEERLRHAGGSPPAVARRRQERLVAAAAAKTSMEEKHHA